MTMQLAKLHGLGNDFLVALADTLPRDAAGMAVRLCNRHRGVGADGLIFGLTHPDGSVAMRLFNSDGSEAELSGNGLLCLVHAIARDRAERHLEIDVGTAAGLRHCSLRAAGPALGTASGTVDMGTARAGPEPDVGDLAGSVVLAEGMRRWQTIDLGNPHVVVEVDDPAGVLPAEVGPAVEAHFSQGANVHFVATSDHDELTMRVWERGAGITAACGTGAIAAAIVFNAWGRVGDRVTVRMPGGESVVTIGPPATLTGPSVHIADLRIDV